MNPDTLAQRVGDEVVLINLKTDRIFVLNRTGARLWELLAARHTRAEIRERLLDEFDVTGGQVDAEIESLLAALRDERLIDADRGA
jgi:hypothetical protein